jgi:hypothetical protein
MRAARFVSQLGVTPVPELVASIVELLIASRS